MPPWMICMLWLVAAANPTAAFAYLGPGAGLGMVGSLIAVILVVCIMILGLLLYPIRRLVRHLREKQAKSSAKAE